MHHLIEWCVYHAKSYAILVGFLGHYHNLAIAMKALAATLMLILLVVHRIQMLYKIMRAVATIIM